MKTILLRSKEGSDANRKGWAFSVADDFPVQNGASIVEIAPYRNAVQCRGMWYRCDCCQKVALEERDPASSGPMHVPSGDKMVLTVRTVCPKCFKEIKRSFVKSVLPSQRAS